jgi:hypothetical protein
MADLASGAMGFIADQIKPLLVSTKLPSLSTLQRDI